jgi:hypothetical protein
MRIGSKYKQGWIEKRYLDAWYGKKRPLFKPGTVRKCLTSLSNSWQLSGVLDSGYPFFRNSAEKKMKNPPGREKDTLG